MATKLVGIQLNELSLVDNPANKDSRVTIFKRATSDETVEAIAKAYLDPQNGAQPFGAFLAARMADEAFSEVREELCPILYSMTDSVMSIVGDASITPDDKMLRVRSSVEEFMNAVRDKIPAVEGELMKLAKVEVSKRKDTSMADEAKKIADLETMVNDLKKKLEDSDKQHNVLVVKASFSDEMRTFFNALKTDAEKDAFIAMTAEQRQAEVKKAKDGDETITIEGQTVRKSEVGASQFEILKAQAKRLDEAEKSIRTANERAATASFEKQAVEDYSHLPGTVQERAAVLAHVATASEAVRKTATEILKAAEATAKAAFGRAGSNHRKSGEGKTAAEELDELAREHAKTNKVSFEKAYASVMETHADLYKRSLEEKSTAN